MRLWSFHPMYLEDADLCRVWQDALLASRALQGLQSGQERPYQQNSQLTRFLAQADPLQAIADYLHYVADEGERRQYCHTKAFRRYAIPLPRSREGVYPAIQSITVTAGQIEFEVWHYGKLLVCKRGGGEAYVRFWSVTHHYPNPLFRIVPGAVESWEKSLDYGYTKKKKRRKKKP